MKSFRIVPYIHQCENCKEFVQEFQPGKKDLIFTSKSSFKNFEHLMSEDINIIYLRDYGNGEPSDEMIEKIYADIKDMSFDRVIAIGGGSIIDVAKILVQETVSPVIDLFEKKIPTKKVKELVVVPTTCGTGSEVTSVSVIELVSRRTKLGLQTDDEFPDAAVLIPELLEELPARFFGMSSIDALIHATESFLSPKATVYSEMFSKEAIRMIISGYKYMEANGAESRNERLKEFIEASNFAGIAFSNAGCAAVHAMSLPFGGAYHVPHGEANYILFTEVLKMYQRIQPEGKIEQLNEILSQCLSCERKQVYEELDKLLGLMLEKKPMKEFGVTREDLTSFTDIVINKQQRLTSNNYVPLNEEQIMEIYHNVY